MKLDGKKIVFPTYCLSSGGNVWFDDEWNEYVEQGEWTIAEFPKEFPKELKELATQLVNANIGQGCCGGCV